MWTAAPFPRRPQLVPEVIFIYLFFCYGLPCVQPKIKSNNNNNKKKTLRGEKNACLFLFFPPRWASRLSLCASVNREEQWRRLDVVGFRRMKKKDQKTNKTKKKQTDKRNDWAPTWAAWEGTHLHVSAPGGGVTLQHPGESVSAALSTTPPCRSARNSRNSAAQPGAGASCAEVRCAFKSRVLAVTRVTRRCSLPLRRLMEPFSGFRKALEGPRGNHC